MPFEQIKSVIGNEERILWEKTDIENKLRGFQRQLALTIIIYLLSISLIATFIVSVFLYQSEDELLILIVTVCMFLVLIFCPTNYLVKNLNDIKRI